MDRRRCRRDVQRRAQVSLYLTDLADGTGINPVHQECFDDTRAVHTFIGGRALVLPEMKVEIAAAATLRR